MSDQKPAQLSFEWDLPEEEASNAALSADEIQGRKDIAQAMLENPASWPKGHDGKPIKPFWFERYLQLLDGVRFPFRAAVLAAWLGTPKKKRWPKTQEELADLLGLSSDRQFSVWRERNPQINEMAQGAWKVRVMEGLADSVDAMLEVAAEPDYKGRGDRELHFKLADVLKDTLTLNSNIDWSKLPFEEKLKLAGLDSAEKLTAAVRAAEQRAQRMNADEEPNEPTDNA